jgi:plasmid stability protein
MAQFTVRNLEDDVKLRLKQRAVRHGHSLEQEVRQILRHAVNEEPVPAAGLGRRIAARFAEIGLTDDLPEWKGDSPQPMPFEP